MVDRFSSVLKFSQFHLCSEAIFVKINRPSS